MRTRFKSGIIKSDISNHFPIFFCYKYIVGKKDAKKGFIYKRRFSEHSTGTSKLTLSDINWSKVKQFRNSNQAYVNFLNIVDSRYDQCSQ